MLPPSPLAVRLGEPLGDSYGSANSGERMPYYSYDRLPSAYLLSEKLAIKLEQLAILGRSLGYKNLGQNFLTGLLLPRIIEQIPAWLIFGWYILEWM